MSIKNASSSLVAGASAPSYCLQEKGSGIEIVRFTFDISHVQMVALLDATYRLVFRELPTANVCDLFAMCSGSLQTGDKS